MGNDESQSAGTREAEDKLSKDIARLYSWANVGDSPYRNFPRPRKSQVQTVDPAKESPVKSSNDPFVEGFEAQPKTSQTAEATIPDTSVRAGASQAADAATEPQSMNANAWATRGIPPPVPTITGARAGIPEPEWRAPMGKSDLRPVMAVYSLAGGVGKTTLCANLGQALSWAGEKVLLVDATGSGLLPFYFGADDLVSGSRTTIAARNDRVSLRVISAEEITEEWLEREVKPAMESSSWTIFDLGPAPMSLLPQILAMTSFLIVPLLPDLNSILTVSRVESSLEIMRSRGAEIPTPFYLFNQFDPEDPIDQGARDLVLRQCGGRLLPLSIPYDTEAAKAIASRMTVIEHDPGAEIASVSLKLATMLRKAVPGHYTRRPARRWNEV